MIKFCGKLLVLCAAKRKLSVFIYVLICVTKLKDKRDYQFFVSVLMCVESEKKVRKILEGRVLYIYKNRVAPQAILLSQVYQFFKRVK